MATENQHPVTVIGAGPVGLAAAAHLIARGLPVRVYEAGATVAAHVRDWGHVRLFSPWEYNVDPMAREILLRHGWREPAADAFPTGAELASAYLEPLAGTPELAPVIETGARVSAISRLGIDKVGSRDRADRPFVLTVIDAHGGTRRELARAVIDASGTWSTQNPLGADGLTAAGEADNVTRVARGIPDVAGRERTAFQGRTTAVVGAGHSQPRPRVRGWIRRPIGRARRPGFPPQGARRCGPRRARPGFRRGGRPSRRGSGRA